NTRARCSRRGHRLSPLHSPSHIGPAPFRGPGCFPGPKGGCTRMTRAYELMVIIDGDVEDTAAQERVKSITDSITKAGGTIHGKPDWGGRRQYASPINKKEYGYYVRYQLVAPGAALDELERPFRIADDIVRHKLIRLPDTEAARR